ncbi:MAG: pyruvate formate-lyase-activating protein [Limisphaerales bacterium]
MAASEPGDGPAVEAEIQEGSRHDLRHDLSPDAPETEGYSDKEGAFGYVHSYETGSRLDGPGVRIALFLSGCPLRCQYCHNPDTWHLKHGTRVSADRVIARLGHFAPALRALRGGLTLSGGEVLVQVAFALRILRASKSMGLHTAIETSGFLGTRATDEFLEQLDLVILDIKSGDPETYRRATQRDLDPTLRFAERLAEIGKPAWVRFTLVPGLTDDPANVEKVGRFVAPLGNVEWVEVLPFHQLGAFKWKALGQEYPLDRTPPASPELVARVIGQFRDAGCRNVR